MPSFVLCNMASKRNCHSMKCYPLKLSTRPASASIVGSMFYMPIDVPPSSCALRSHTHLLKRRGYTYAM